jgi:CPA2 family monovalent cation:H+ antiporter-2
MPHEQELLLTMTGALTAALCLGFATERMRLSPIVGYLLAGIVVGPFTPGFVAHRMIATQLSELGVILLLFGVGLHFHVSELLAVRSVAVPGALVQIAASTTLGAASAFALGWSVASGVVFGLAISVASTVVLVRVLSDGDVLRSPAGHLAVGWLLVEDLFTVVVLVVLPLVAGEHGGGAAHVVLSIALGIGKVVALVALAVFVGRPLIPRILEYMARTGSREMFTLTVLVIALGVAVCSVELFGVSMALGAFLAGAMVGQSSVGERAAADALPMRDAFAVLFFVSIGMLLDPAQIVAHARLTAVTVAIVVAAKPLFAYLVVRLRRLPAETAVPVAIALAQIGEFSFVETVLARDLGILPEAAMQALVAASIVSITLNPLLFRQAGRIAAWLAPRAKAGG